ncbi:hypothetical protein JVU11DRAFT_8215 [Chiua virens]|nr:hypothetical protein JVU11DRAFT_8215 [Chiua virens]
MSDFHTLERTTQYQVGSTVTIRRDGVTGKLSCPCGDPLHARFSFQKIYSLCRKKVHPKDPDVFPDINPSVPDFFSNANATVSSSSLPEHDECIPVKGYPASNPIPPQELQTKSPAPSPMDIDPHGDLMPSMVVTDLPLQYDSTPFSEPINLPTSPVILSTPQRLLSWGLRVESQFKLTICVPCSSPINFETAHSHIRDRHKIPRDAPAPLPSKEELINMLRSLDADKVVTEIRGPISPIEGLPLVDAFKCTIPGCPSPFVFPSSRRFDEHCQSDHPNAPKRTSRAVKGHFLSNALVSRKMVEVSDLPSASPISLSDSVEHYLASVKLYSFPSVFQKLSDERLKGTIFAQVGWDQLLVGVDIRELRKTVATPTVVDVEYYRLTQSVESYYTLVSLLISSLPVLTARAVLSTGELGSKLFKPLQESTTLKKYSRFLALFLVFLLRHSINPVAHFSVPFHPSHVEHLSSLRALLGVDEPRMLQEKIHSTLIALLMHLSHEATLSDRKDLFSLFLLVYHLRDDAGNMTKASAIPPNISAVQWCLRATAVAELLQKADLYDGDTFKAYEAHVKHLITDGRPGLFTYLRQKLAFFSTLSYSEPGLPQFIWDATMTVLSVDGFPLSVDCVQKSVDAVRTEMEGLIKRLTLSCDFSDALSYIDSRTDPGNPSMWFVDHPREDLQGTSIVSQDPKGLLTFSRRLLDRLASDGTYFLDTKGSLVACQSQIWRWLSDLDDLVSAMYYAITLTWGGGARGTECDHLRHTIHGPGERHVFILNGCLSIVTTYVKTQHVQGHGRLIIRTPAHSISRLAIFVLSVLYPVAAKLASFVMDVSLARNYLSYLFIHHGSILNSKNFSSILHRYTEKFLGLPMGLREWRQVMCSMLCCLAGTDFGAPDEDDHDLAMIHSQFGHTAVVANAHYGIQGTNALPMISHTSVRSMQRVSARWHASLGCLHPHVMGNVNDSSPEEKHLRFLDSFKAQILSSVQNAARESLQGCYRTVFPQWTSVLQGFASDFTSHFNQILARPSVFTPSQLPPLIVHPLLASYIKPLFPGESDFAFTSHYQAELVQSCLTNDHVLAIMPTGSGKSLAFFAAPLLNPQSLFIVVTPFVALTEDMDRRLASSPIPGGKWSADLNPFDAQLVIVPAHEAATDCFFQWAEASSSRLQRIFVDEAHHVFTSDSYRSCFKLFHRLTQLRKPITFLTATMPIHSIPALCQSMMIDPLLLRIIRAPVSRPNIKYTVVHVQSKYVIQKTVELFNSLQLKEDERGVIYTTSIAFTKEIAELLGIPAYTSHVLSDERQNKIEKSSRFQAWRSGAVQWVAATVCFAEGVDFPSVRYAIIVEPREMLSFLQESGRLGRDGLPSYAFTIWSFIPTQAPSDDPDHSGKRSMADFLQANSCRRLAFKHFDPDVHSCASSVKSVLCDQCEQLSKSSNLFVPQPLRFDLPLVKKPTVPAPIACWNKAPPLPVSVPLSIEANADHIRNAYNTGRAQLEALRRIIARIAAIDCPDCWILGESRVEPHTHTRPYLFNSLLSSLRAKKRTENTFWPSCYLCWVPFRAPCDHPVIRRGDKLAADDCPNAKIPYLIPTLVSLVYLYDGRSDSRSFLSSLSTKLLLQPALSSEKPLSQFLDWMTEPSPSPDRIPNFAVFLIAFSECFNR